jgi:S-adenosylmethionine hydrolase
MSLSKSFTFLLLLFCLTRASAQNNIVVLQTDFGLKDGAVSAMKGVAMGVSPNIKLFDLTHAIPNYNIWEASYRLYQTISYYPKGTVFVSVVDPGVGTSRKSVVIKTKTGQFIVTPDNGTLTHVAEAFGIAEVREINEAVNRRKESGKSYTFHGRDVYVYTAARLATGVITYQQVGKVLPTHVVMIPYQHSVFENGVLKGTIDVLDVQYGNIWTDINDELVAKLHITFGDVLHFKIFNNNIKVYEGDAPYSKTFGDVPEGKPLAYLNSLLQLSFALNMGSFAEAHKIGSGSEWSVEVTKP